ncbi:MAG: glycoside hydrolase family 32 protein [Luteolibacter sp.]|uniref:glycoside hydrolase family 32 protein n=1 Tax=Luteolibacter sp. TaxID=1962973 RepID=UPI003267A396
MVFDGRDYHLFFQHNPLGTGGGNQVWGHSVSTDMLHWRQVDHALLPYQVDGRNGVIYSGTAVVDHNNSLGMQVSSRKTLVAFFTYANTGPSYQAMAYSTDGGVTWQYYNNGRAVVPNQGFDNVERDPKVFWHEASQRWVMVLWVHTNPGRVRFFTSTNLKDWTFASDLLRDWAFECMDLFFAPVDGNPANTKCVIYDASFDYEIGTFDGTTFTTEAGPFHASRGDFYAAQTFNQAPGGRTVQIGWMNGGPNSATSYGVPFNQQMSFPCDLTLRTTPSGVRLCSFPIPEISTLVNSTQVVTEQALTTTSNLFNGMGTLDLVDLSLEFSPGTATQIAIDLPRTTVRYDVASGALTHTGTNGSTVTSVDGPLTPRNGRVKLRLLLDRLSLEAYAFDGESFGAHYISPTGGTGTPSLRSIGGQAYVYSLSVKSLNSSWTPETPLATTILNPGFETGIPSGSTFHNAVPNWTAFGDWTDAAGYLDDSNDALTQAAGYPNFTGLGAASLKARNRATENRAGLFQSLGHVASADLGKTFTLGADLGARIMDGPGNYAYTGDLTVSFRKGVTAGVPGDKGTLLGSAGTKTVNADDAALPSLANVTPVRATAVFTPVLADVGTEIFAVIDLQNTSGSTTATDGEKQYLADNVTLEADFPIIPAGPMAYEGFDYAAGSANLSGKNGGIGWAAAWQTVDSSSADIIAGSLAAGGNAPADFGLLSSGNNTRLPNGRRIGRLLDTTLTGPFGARGYVDSNGRIGGDGTTLYVSFLQQPNGTSLFYEFEFHRDNLGDSGRIAGIGNDQAGNNINLRAPNSVQTTIGAGSTAVNFYVMRIDFKAGNDDVYIYRNPTSPTEPGSPTLTRLAAADMSFNGISFGAFVNGRTVAHDEIRMARSWTEAVGQTPFTAWTNVKGLDGSPGRSPAFGADPDGDAIPNGLEWILGGNPLARDAAASVTSSADDGLTLSFTRDESSLGSSTLAVQWSSGLDGSWTDIPIDQNGGTHSGGVVVTVNESATPDMVTVHIPASNTANGRIFARLRATIP